MILILFGPRPAADCYKRILFLYYFLFLNVPSRYGRIRSWGRGRGRIVTFFDCILQCIHNVPPLRFVFRQAGEDVDRVGKWVEQVSHRNAPMTKQGSPKHEMHRKCWIDQTHGSPYAPQLKLSLILLLNPVMAYSLTPSINHFTVPHLTHIQPS